MKKKIFSKVSANTLVVIIFFIVAAVVFSRALIKLSQKDVNAEVFTPNATTQGLLASYYQGINFQTLVNERIDSTIQFNWGNQSPVIGVSRDNFSVRWQGYIKPLYSEQYTFFAKTDDGVRVWINDTLIIDRWRDKGFYEVRGSISLRNDTYYRIKMEYYDRSGPAQAELRWRSASQRKQIIPTEQLYAVSSLPGDSFPGITPTPSMLPTTQISPTRSIEPTPTLQPTVTPTLVPQPSPTATPNPTPGPEFPQGEQTILKQYKVNPYPVYGKTVYRPRQFQVGSDISARQNAERLIVSNTGSYTGWDVFVTPNDGINRVMNSDRFIELVLQRKATLAIVWRGGSTNLPTWLTSNWIPGERVGIGSAQYPTYKRSFEAGEVVLGGVYSGSGLGSTPRDTYLVLFGEENELGSSAPYVPPGYETPIANEYCPTWVHDQYKTIGPDGLEYPTWHPPVDPVYWCYFGHEHGSDPQVFLPGYKPPFGYAAKKMGMSEPHAGFKTYVFSENPSSNRKLLITQHMGSAGLARVCIRHHTLDMAIADRNTNKLIAETFTMGDFGKAVENVTEVNLTPDACPDQAVAAERDGSFGIRKIPTVSSGSVFYEPWRVDGGTGRAIGYQLNSFTINTNAAVVICDNSNCNNAVTTGSDGIWRFVNFSPGLGIVAGQNSGVFYTDPMGNTVVNSTAPNAVKQFVTSGLSYRNEFPSQQNDNECYPTHPWIGEYLCTQNSTIDQFINIEQSVRSPN